MTTLGIIIGNRGFFPAHLCEAGRREILQAFEKAELKAVTLPVEATRFGAVESLAGAIEDALSTYLGWQVYHHG
ncbi:hypothetical protein SBV1_1730005 [Verrucomicrobia bacterium]|nr:hypothetical protein SBV1_1730005 [Verrucomicrobiota bacterium]